MMMHDRNSGISLNNCRIFDTGKSLLNFECHSIALNNQETHLLLVGNHELAFINFETISSQFDSTTVNDKRASLRPLFDVKIVPLFDSHNINRPIVEWNHCDSKQYAVAIDRLVRLYTVDHGNINETTSVIDSQHQRPISTVSYAPHDPHWLITGSLDGQIQVWDTRQCSSKTPASLKFTVSTPFSIRRVQWSSANSENSNQLAVQCDRCIRVYDIRRADSHLLSPTDLQHKQRIICMDWVKQTPAIVSMCMDQSIRIFSLDGRTIAESSVNEQSSCTFSKIRTTMCDNLLVSASRDTTSSTYGFLGWHWDGDKCLQPLNNRILTVTSSPIVDFTFVNHSRFYNLFNNSSPSSPMTDDLTNHFLILTWCRDGNLCLVEMDSIFRQTFMNQHTRTKLTNSSDVVCSINNSRTSKHLTRHNGISQTNWSIAEKDSIQSETADSGETVDDDDDDDCSSPFQPMPASPPNTAESSDGSDENEYPIMADKSDNQLQEVSIENEFNSINDTYGEYIFIEKKDEQRRMCVLRCIYSSDKTSKFHIYLIFSRHYPIISQLFIRFKLSVKNNDEQFESLQSQIKTMFEQTCYKCFYQGQLCLDRCLRKLKTLIDNYLKQELSFADNRSETTNTNQRRNKTSSNFDIDSMNDFTNSDHDNAHKNNDNNSNRLFTTSSSSVRTHESQTSVDSFSQTRHRTCGARFSGSSQLICFGQIANHVQSSSAPALASLNDGPLNRPQSLPIRSTSLTLAKTRENSSTDEQSSYRTTTITPSTTTNTVQIQYVPSSQRTPIFSAPVRSSFGTSIFSDHQRLSIGNRRSLGHISHPHSTVSIYDVSILLPVSRELADHYKIDLKNPIEMCANNQDLAREMGKNDLTHCWRLLGGLLSLQPSLKNDDPWFQTPIAQGLIKHIVSNYIKNSDIQSASMFLLAMSQTSYLKTRIQTRLISEHNFDPILYSYASLLHRWRHFYKRTQILSEIDHNCQSPAPFTQITSAQVSIICSICLQPVLGQHFLCAICGHGGHLMHMHEWFTSEGLKHRYCPEKDCSCRCIIKQQELLAMNTIQLQQQQQQPLPITPRPFMTRQSSNSFRPL